MEIGKFDAVKYFTRLTEQNRLAREHGFRAVVFSDTDSLEGICTNMRDEDRFVAISDTSSGNLASPDGTYGFSKRRAYTVFILSAYEFDNMEDRQRQMELCRELFHQFASRIIRDKYQYKDMGMFFDTHSFPNQEIGRYFLSGMTGLHFTLYEQEPISLCYDSEQWEE